MLDVFIHGIAQISGKAGGCLGGVLARQHAQHQRNGCHQKGKQAVADDGVHIALFNALIDDKGHDGGQQHIHNGFQSRKERCLDRGGFILAQMRHKLFDHLSSLLFEFICLLQNNFIQNNLNVKPFRKMFTIANLTSSFSAL